MRITGFQGTSSGVDATKSGLLSRPIGRFFVIQQPLCGRRQDLSPRRRHSGGLSKRQKDDPLRPARSAVKNQEAYENQPLRVRVLRGVQVSRT